MIIQYNDANFRALFPAFANTVTYPQSAVQIFWDNATAYVGNVSGGCYIGSFTPAQQILALNQMAAHLLYLNGLAEKGKNGGVLTGATIDKITVSYQPPPETNQWQFWLNQSPYGQQLLALLQVASAGGFYVANGFSAMAGFQGRW